jgi:hypothetical protein
MTSASREVVRTVMITARRILLRIGNVSDKICREKQNICFRFSNSFSEHRAVYGIMWENTGRNRQTIDDSIIRRMCFACWITRATDMCKRRVHAHAFRISNMYCFSMAKLVMRARPTVNLHYVDCLPRYILKRP